MHVRQILVAVAALAGSALSAPTADDSKLRISKRSPVPYLRWGLGIQRPHPGPPDLRTKSRKEEPPR